MSQTANKSIPKFLGGVIADSSKCASEQGASGIV
jgi:hypothetical protein